VASLATVLPICYCSENNLSQFKAGILVGLIILLTGITASIQGQSKITGFIQEEKKIFPGFSRA
jgi:F0F1-type ATP synthase membrane subunit c/vacuolar-type H+-ATPase subunit K